MLPFRVSLPTQPRAESIPLCDGCVVKGPDFDPERDRYFSPMKAFRMHMSQAKLPKNERMGFDVVDISVHSRRQMPTGFDENDQPTEYQEAVFYEECPEVGRDVELLPSDWDRIRADGCPGPEVGKRRLGFGPRKVTCGLLRIMKEASISN